MDDTVILPKKTVDLMTCTAEIIAEHLDHGYVEPADAKQLRSAVNEVQAAARRTGFATTESSQRTLWGD